MITNFAERWAQKERETGRGDMPAPMISYRDDVLPGRAAPFVTFQEAANPRPIWEVYGPASYWTPEDRERMAAYRMIGSDGAGNPICVEQPSDAVVLLDHEDNFRTQEFINSSVDQLRECLLAYMGETDPEIFRRAIAAIDPDAVNEKTFWWYEIINLAEKDEDE